MPKMFIRILKMSQNVNKNRALDLRNPEPASVAAQWLRMSRLLGKSMRPSGILHTRLATV